MISAHDECINVSRTHLPRLNDSHDNAKQRHSENRKGVVHVIICKPETEREELEHVEWVEHLKEQQRQNAVDRDEDLVVTVHQAAQGLLLI